MKVNKTYLIIKVEMLKDNWFNVKYVKNKIICYSNFNYFFVNLPLDVFIFEGRFTF